MHQLANVHLYKKWFMPNYKLQIFHGEKSKEKSLEKAKEVAPLHFKGS